MSPPPEPPDDYRSRWNAIASNRQHAFELVDESQTEEQLAAHGRQQAPYLIRGLALGPRDVVLEIGCGVARLGREIAPVVGTWIGVDVSHEMLAIARDRLSGLANVRLVESAGNALAGVEDRSVDKIYSHAVFVHLDKEDWYAYLVEARRVLRPGGLFYFDVWNLADPVGWVRWQVERLLHRQPGARPVHRNRFSTPDEVRAMLRMSGWELLHLAESFAIHAVATYPEPGASRARFLAEIEARYGRCYAELTYGAGDRDGFLRTLSERLREHGIEPEDRPPDIYARA